MDPQRPVHVVLDDGREEAPVASSGQGVGERCFAQLPVGRGELGAPRGHGFLQTPPLGLQVSRPPADDEDEDQFPSYAPRVKTHDGLDITSNDGEGNEALQNAARNLTSQMRRRGQAAETEGAQVASGTSLFPSKATTTTGNPALAQTEALLSHDRNEQENLTESLVQMAQQLKAQSVHFNNTLEGDKGIVDRAVSGLDSNQINMDAASRRMGTLRRMTEGRGWWDRIKLYAMIGGLWLLAFLIVFMGPKIRF